MGLPEGIDVSSHNGDPTLRGLSFLFARACYATRADSKYARHVARARAAGLVVGAYIFGVGGRQASVAAQVATFLRIAKGADLLALDLETNGTGATMTNAEARQFIALVHKAGHPIGLYHSRSGFPALGQDWNWCAQWRTAPPVGIAWRFWQYQGSPLDRNRFNGSEAELRRLAGRPVIVTSPAPISLPSVSASGAATTSASGAAAIQVSVIAQEDPMPPDRRTVLRAAIAKNRGYLAEKQALVYHDKIEAFQTELAEIERTSAPTDGLFEPAADPDVIYLFGGSPGNPDGVSYSYGQAHQWWERVFAENLNIARVRPTLTPGSEVLSAAGYRAAVDLGKASTNYAPADWNPLNLEVIP